jgi:hypothetical protein
LYYKDNVSSILSRDVGTYFMFSGTVIRVGMSKVLETECEYV